MRLGDAVSLRWENVNFADGVLGYHASKTKSDIEIPMHPALQRHLESIAGDTIGEISPTLARKKVPGRSGLSHQFMQIMRSAGIDADQIRGHKSRLFSKRSFHSLRHTFVSQMANAGVAPELRQKLAGHSSGGSHRKYTHLELQTLRAAIEELPAQ
jgi:Site-specific recombinase XerD